MTSHLSSSSIIDVVTHAHNSYLANSVFAQLNWFKLKLRVKKKVRTLDVQNIFYNLIIINVIVNRLARVTGSTSNKNVVRYGTG